MPMSLPYRVAVHTATSTISRAWRGTDKHVGTRSWTDGFLIDTTSELVSGGYRRRPPDSYVWQRRHFALETLNVAVVHKHTGCGGVGCVATTDNWNCQSRACAYGNA